jgi:transcriptional regulator with XRE-family HTH domain
MPKLLTNGDIGRRIQFCRKQRDLSQGVVARRAKIVPSYLSRIERGKVHPTLRTTMKIARALRVSLDDLFEPSPVDKKDQPCPVTPKGFCLMDLIDATVHNEKGQDPAKFTPTQIRLIRRFTWLIQNGSAEMLRALDVVIRGIGDGLDGQVETPS